MSLFLRTRKSWQRGFVKLSSLRSDGFEAPLKIDSTSGVQVNDTSIFLLHIHMTIIILKWWITRKKNITMSYNDTPMFKFPIPMCSVLFFFFYNFQVLNQGMDRRELKHMKTGLCSKQNKHWDVNHPHF